MVIEIHTHTLEHSPCSQISAVDLVESIYERGIVGVVLTDHHYLWTDEEIRGLREKINIPDDFIILAGQEVFTKDFGDVLVYGANESIPQGTSLQKLRNKFPEAALVWAHPYRSGLKPLVTDLFNPCFDALEVINPRQKEWENEQAVLDWKTWGFIATSGTDIHEENVPELYPLHLQENIEDINGLVACIKSGKCLPVMNKYISTNLQNI